MCLLSRTKSLRLQYISYDFFGVQQYGYLHSQEVALFAFSADKVATGVELFQVFTEFKIDGSRSRQISGGI